MKVYPIIAISTDGIQLIQDTWDSLTKKQKEALRSIKNQSLKFKTLTYQSKTWKIYAISIKPAWLQRLSDFLGLDIIIWKIWRQDGLEYGKEWESYNATVEEGAPQVPVYERQWIDDGVDGEGNPIGHWENVQVGMEDQYKSRAIGTAIHPGNDNWAQQIAEERRDINNNPIAFIDNQDALDSMPVIFGQAKRIL